MAQKMFKKVTFFSKDLFAHGEKKMKVLELRHG